MLYGIAEPKRDFSKVTVDPSPEVDENGKDGLARLKAATGLRFYPLKQHAASSTIGDALTIGTREALKAFV